MCRQDVSDINTPSSGTSVSKVFLEPVRDAGSCCYITVSTVSMAQAEDPPSCPVSPVPTRHVVMASPEHDIPHCPGLCMRTSKPTQALNKALYNSMCHIQMLRCLLGLELTTIIIHVVNSDCHKMSSYDLFRHKQDHSFENPAILAKLHP